MNLESIPPRRCSPRKVVFEKSMSAPLPISIRNYLRGFVARQRVAAVLTTLAWALTFALAWTLLACLGDRYLQFPAWLRMSLFIIGPAATLAILLLPLRRSLRRSIDWIGAAEAV